MASFSWMEFADEAKVFEGIVAEGGLPNFGAAELGAAELGAAELGAAELGAAEKSAIEIDFSGVDFSKISADLDKMLSEFESASAGASVKECWGADGDVVESVVGKVESVIGKIGKDCGKVEERRALRRKVFPDGLIAATEPDERLKGLGFGDASSGLADESTWVRLDNGEVLEIGHAQMLMTPALLRNWAHTGRDLTDRDEQRILRARRTLIERGVYKMRLFSQYKVLRELGGDGMRVMGSVEFDDGSKYEIVENDVVYYGPVQLLAVVEMKIGRALSILERRRFLSERRCVVRRLTKERKKVGVGLVMSKRGIFGLRSQ